MSVFADSSAVVKLYLLEEGRETVRAVDVIAVSWLTRVEVVSAIWAKERDGRISAGEARTLIRRVQADFHGSPAADPRFETVVLDQPVLEHAAELLAVYPLSSGDAIQLASALAARDADPGCRTFACFDGRLRDAAAKSGLELLPA